MQTNPKPRMPANSKPILETRWVYIEEIKSIKKNNNPHLEILNKKYDEGGIVNFEITKNSVLLSIDWVNFPPNPKINEFSVIEIEAKKIWWETIPDSSKFIPILRHKK